MIARRLLIATLLATLAWPIFAAGPACPCERARPVERGCCPEEKPTPKKAPTPAEGCCTIAPEDPDNRAAVQNAHSAAPTAPRAAFDPGGAPALGRQIAFDLRAPIRGGDPPGDPPSLHISNCTFRI